MIRLYIIGFSILIGAIVLNVIIQKLGIMGWYEFLGKLQEQGKAVFSTMRAIDYLWLFLGYPFLLGMSYLLGEKIYGLFVR